MDLFTQENDKYKNILIEIIMDKFKNDNHNNININDFIETSYLNKDIDIIFNKNDNKKFIMKDYKNEMLGNEQLKYNICDNKYCFSYSCSKNKYPLVKINGEKKFVYINRIGKNNHNNKCEGKILYLKNNTFELIPDLNQSRDCIYISGNSGCGKTYFAKQFAKKYKQLYNNREVFLFCRKDDDISLDDIKPTRILINDEFMEPDTKFNYKVFKNSLVIFDDIENIGNKEEKKKILNIAEQILNMGRSLNISIIMISHILMNNKTTKAILSECNKVVLFPYSGSHYHYIEYLNRYIGLSRKHAKKLLSENSRWMVIFRNCPQFFMFEKKIIMNI